MIALPKHPFIYEINTWVWLRELSHTYDRSVSLADVPSNEWDALADLGADAVWLMGVWERSPAGIRIAMTNDVLMADFRRALHDFMAEDIVGSPYCVRRYVVDKRLGGPDGLAGARRQLAQRGLRLILDYVPNHVAPDHPWLSEHPEYFIHGTKEDLVQNPAAFLEVGDHIIACGKDPNYPAWPDVCQLNAFHPGLRQAVVETLDGIVSQCDGLRCDMAMLLMTPHF
jgi:glycosidase